MPHRWIALPVLLAAMAGVSLAASPVGTGSTHAAERCLSAWPMLRSDPQKFSMVATPDLPSTIVAVRFGALEGEFPKLFMFLLRGRECFLKAIVAGSYEATTKGARNARQIGPDERMYHLDLYEGGGHATLGFSTEPYTFEQVREIALEHLK